MIIAFATAATYGAAAWLGVLLADALYSDRKPFEDGPESIAAPAWLFIAAGAAIGAAVALHHPGLSQLVTVGLVTVALVACTATDLRCGLVPDVFTLVPLVALVAWFAVHGNYGPALSAALVAVPFAAVAFATRGRGMGWGDVKLAALGGALLGARGAVMALAIACVAAFALTRFLGTRKKQPIAFAPYLVGGIGAVLMIGASV